MKSERSAALKYSGLACLCAHCPVFAGYLFVWGDAMTDDWSAQTAERSGTTSKRQCALASAGMKDFGDCLCDNLIFQSYFKVNSMNSEYYLFMRFTLIFNIRIK